MQKKKEKEGKEERRRKMKKKERRRNIYQLGERVVNDRTMWVHFRELFI